MANHSFVRRADQRGGVDGKPAPLRTDSVGRKCAPGSAAPGCPRGESDIRLARQVSGCLTQPNFFSTLFDKNQTQPALNTSSASPVASLKRFSLQPSSEQQGRGKRSAREVHAEFHKKRTERAPTNHSIKPQCAHHPPRPAASLAARAFHTIALRSRACFTGGTTWQRW